MNNLKRGIYGLEFPNRSIYIGLSWNPQARLHYHAKRTHNRLVREELDNHEYYYELIFDGWYVGEEASLMERETVEYYRDRGYRILNLMVPGGLGGCKHVWTKDEVLTEARKYPNRSAFQNGNTMAYIIAKRYGWYDEACAHMGEPLIQFKWTPETIADEAKKYNRREDFRLGSGGAYQKACKYKILNEVCAHMHPLRENLWNKERCAIVALRCDTMEEFISEFSGARYRAYNEGWLKEICAHMPRSAPGIQPR